VIALKPSLLGALNVTEADLSPRVAVPIAGASGTVAGTTAFDASDGALEPTALVASTVKVYEVPFVSPVTVAVVAVPDTVSVAPPGVATTV
jgi:hypothetical protein